MGIAGKSHIGLSRSKNEDCYAIEEDLGVFLIADGIGGHQYGEVASKMAVETYIKSYREALDTEILDRIRKAFRDANDAVHRYQEEKAAGLVMGTTLTVACLEEEDLYIGHVGDSRAYISRFKEDIQQMTEDHTFYNELAKHDPKTLEHLSSGTFRLQQDYLAKAIGPEKYVVPQILKVALLEGDRILLLTDGVYKYFSSAQLLDLLNQSKSPERVCTALEEGALEGGGKDNLTSVVYFHERR